MKKLIIAGIVGLAVLNGGVYAKDAKPAKAAKPAATKPATTKPAAKTPPPKPDDKTIYASYVDMYDRNMDGKFDDSEKLGMKEKEKTELAKIIAKYDKNKDGMLDDAEKAAMAPAAAKKPAAKSK